MGPPEDAGEGVEKGLAAGDTTGPSRPAEDAARPPSLPRQLVIAHRGLHAARRGVAGAGGGHPAGCPENTLAAFERAAAAGADGIETDVRLSRDGLPVLFHDRTAPDGQAVADLTAEELSAAAGYPVPTLDRALEMPADLLWNVEIKTPAAAPAARAVLAACASRRRILVTSFWHSLIPPFRSLGVETGLLLASRPIDAGALLALLPSDGSVSTLVWDYEILDPELLAAAAEEGLRSWTYGVETLAEHRRCRALAACLTGVITDYPALFRRLVRRPP
jgi:glycerophosphoryl diester phosphodiesterase